MKGVLLALGMLGLLVIALSSLGAAPPLAIGHFALACGATGLCLGLGLGDL